MSISSENYYKCNGFKILQMKSAKESCTQDVVLK